MNSTMSTVRWWGCPWILTSHTWHGSTLHVRYSLPDAPLCYGSEHTVGMVGLILRMTNFLELTATFNKRNLKHPFIRPSICPSSVLSLSTLESQGSAEPWVGNLLHSKSLFPPGKENPGRRKYILLFFDTQRRCHCIYWGF